MASSVKIVEELIGKRFRIPYYSRPLAYTGPRDMVDQNYGQAYQRVYEIVDDEVQIAIDQIEVEIEKAELYAERDQHISYLVNDRYIINIVIIGKLIQDIEQLS